MGIIPKKYKEICYRFFIIYYKWNICFLSVFWAFFHSSLSASIAIGGVWPPAGITPLDPYSIPMLNTFLLVSSGGFITYGHHALMQGKEKMLYEE